MITAEYARQLLDYDPETGVLRWKEDRGHMKAGSVAGSHGHPSNPYYAIKIDKVLYKNHRLAWLIVFGWMPEAIDHIDGDPSNNRLSNLRACTMTQNKGNSRRYKNNKLGFKGVHRSGDKYRAYVQHNGAKHHLGYFDTVEAAALAYERKAKELFGEFARAE